LKEKRKRKFTPKENSYFSFVSEKMKGGFEGDPQTKMKEVAAEWQQIKLQRQNTF